MKIELKTIKIRDLVKGYSDNEGLKKWREIISRLGTWVERQLLKICK